MRMDSYLLVAAEPLGPFNEAEPLGPFNEAICHGEGRRGLLWGRFGDFKQV